ncbi:MAG: Ig-like domain-containing protein [Pseudomonadota bacterium]|nr:Ig-like domain-containing protein [Pseudomonadota bacterium]
MIQTLRWLGFFSVVLLAGCGGSAGGEGSEAQFYEPGINLSMSVSSTGETDTSIPANDDAKVMIVLLDDGNLPLDNEIISLSATSGSISQSSVLTSNTGQASVTIYSPDSLESGTAPGTLTATAGDYTATLNYQFVATISGEGSNTSSAGSIQFINAEPTFMSLKGTGGQGYGETSQVTFKVVDILGSPIEGAEVNFTLSTTVGGLTLSPASGSSNASGLVTTTVQAGTISTPVRVGASVTLSDGELIYVQSDLLTVTTGIPDQNSIDLTLDKYAPEGWDYSGQIVNVTARLGDRFNNPVPDGTVINFTTEGGLIGDDDRSTASCLTADSECTVRWKSQNPRPSDHRSTILAYAIGHETFYDFNANGVFDDGDVFDDLGEAFRDDDETLTFNPDSGNGFSIDEKLIDYDENAAYSGPDGVYNGVPCEHSTDCPTDANNIAGRSNFLTNVRAQKVLIMADSAPNVEMYELLSGGSCLDGNGKLVIDGVRCQAVTSFSAGLDVKTIWVLIEDGSDEFVQKSTALCLTASGERISDMTDPNHEDCTVAVRQSAPTGASISVSSEVGTLSTIPYATVRNATNHLEFTFSVTADDENADPETGVLEVKVSTPVGGVDVYSSVSMTDPAL